MFSLAGPEIPALGKCEDSASSVVNGMGSMVNCPLCMAARTERRDNQLNDGARSNRMVGSLSSECKEPDINERDENYEIGELTNLRLIDASGKAREEG